MNICILTNGTRGDIQPLIYLGIELFKKNHSVTIVASNNFKDLIIPHGLKHYPMPVNLQDFTESIKGDNPLKVLFTIKNAMPNLVKDTLNAYWEGSNGADLLISTTGALGDIYISKKRDIPLVEVQLQPLEPTGDFPYPFINIPNISKKLNKISYYLFESILWNTFKKHLNKWQKENFNKVYYFKRGSFAERRRSSTLKIGAYSPTLINRPIDWPSNYHITGHFLDPEINNIIIEEDIKEFIDFGIAPIYIGFGSMPIKDINNFMNIIIKLVEDTSIRVILNKGWSDISLDKCPRNLLIVDNVCHFWLFSKCKGIVHHGGAGTTAAALLSGKPQVIVPKTADQPFWAKKCRDLNVSLTVKDISSLTISKWINLYNFMNSEKAINAAEIIKDSISKEAGIENAIELILSAVT